MRVSGVCECVWRAFACMFSESWHVCFSCVLVSDTARYKYIYTSIYNMHRRVCVFFCLFTGMYVFGCLRVYVCVCAYVVNSLGVWLQ